MDSQEQQPEGESTNIRMKNHNSYNFSIINVENVTNNYANMTSSISEVSWLMVLLDRSQQVMTIVGLIANIGTSVTLIKNGEVSMTSNNKGICWCDRCLV